MASVSEKQVKALVRRANAVSWRKLRLHRSKTDAGQYEIVEAPYWQAFKGTLDQCAIWLLGYLKLATKGTPRSRAARREATAKEPLKNPVSTRAGKWTKKYKDALPDSAFLIVDKRGKTTTKNGKTHPLSQRHLPYKDKAGNVSVAHLRNAISRAPQTTSVPVADRKAAQARARKLLAQIEGK